MSVVRCPVCDWKFYDHEVCPSDKLEDYPYINDMIDRVRLCHFEIDNATLKDMVREYLWVMGYDVENNDFEVSIKFKEVID